ncbi:MAG: P-loop NTPase [Promethearchaeota archaeon]
MERKIVGIISGKGGVGKTSITASLANLAQNDLKIEVMTLDCDVDAPNLAIILPPEINSKIDQKDTFTSLKAEFLEDLCINCKQCIDNQFCEFKSLKWDDQSSIPKINFLKCEGCGACKVLCPTHAFEIKAVKSGQIISYATNFGFPLIYGKTELGSTTSGKLVSDIKDYMNNLNNFNNHNLVLIDGPPGIGCPVIATISNLDYIITISEPTPSGLHDLMRVIEVIEQFNLPFGLVINKSDLQSPFQNKFKKLIEETGYTVLGKIPFDLAIPEAMSYAQPFVQYKPSSKASLAIKEIYTNLKKVLWN